jgi:hypothetical protein
MQDVKKKKIEKWEKNKKHDKKHDKEKDENRKKK